MKLPKISLKKPQIIALGVSATAIAGLAGFTGYESLSMKSKLKKAFPQTEITSIDCGAGPGPLCEVVAGSNVFYTTRDVKIALVGSVLDLRRKVDLTDERLRQLAAMQEGEARIAGSTGAGAQAPDPTAMRAGQQEQQASGVKVDMAALAALPKSNAIVHNRGAALKIIVFSDFNCSFCQRLANDLKSVTDIEVTEYPVAILGNDSLEKAKLALCATDRVAAQNAILSGGEVKVSGDCSAADAAVKANTDFFHKSNMQGTPVIVRADGQVNEGWMPQNELRAFIGGR